MRHQSAYGRDRDREKPPPLIYRFRKADDEQLRFLEDLLRNHRLRLGSPPRFNDVHECHAYIDFKSDEAASRAYYRRMLATLRAPEETRDARVEEFIATGVWKDPEKQLGIAAQLQALLNNTGIICFTASVVEQVVWSHYTDAHAGFCLCFSTDRDPLRQVWRVSYRPDFHQVAFDADMNMMAEALLLTKEDSYRWENEWRLVEFNKGEGFIDIAPDALRAIIVGMRTSPEYKQRLVDLVSSLAPRVELLEATTRAGSYKLAVKSLQGAAVSAAMQRATGD